MKTKVETQHPQDETVELALGIEPPVFVANHLLDMARTAFEVLLPDNLQNGSLVIPDPAQYLIPLAKVIAPREKLSPALEVALAPVQFAKMDLTGTIEGPRPGRVGNGSVAVVAEVGLEGADAQGLQDKVLSRFDELGFEISGVIPHHVVLLVFLEPSKRQEEQLGLLAEHAKKVQFGIHGLWVFEVTQHVDGRPVAGRRYRFWR